MGSFRKYSHIGQILLVSYSNDSGAALFLAVQCCLRDLGWGVLLSILISHSYLYRQYVVWLAALSPKPEIRVADL